MKPAERTTSRSTGRPGAEAVAAKGWLRAHRWLLLRRASQLGVLALFLSGPWFGLWIARGNLASSLTLDMLPLTDPYVLLQSLLAAPLSGHLPAATAWLGAALVLLAYALVGGRVYCSWVCPMNAVTDTSAWLRTRLGWRSGGRLPRHTRLWLLGTTLVMAAATGSLVWELVNPVSLLQRALVFGGGAAWGVVAAIFLFDLAVVPRGWCGHLCPVGAFYGLLGPARVLTMTARHRNACNDCADCYAVCPEPLVIKPALKAVNGAGPAITSAQCTHCARCIDVCSQNVFTFSLRRPAAPQVPPETP